MARPKGSPRTPGSGRKKGTKNAKTLARKEIAEKALTNGVTPLQVMLGTMRALWARAKRAKKAEAKATYQAKASEIAKDAAPYVHPRLTAVEMTGDMTLRHEDWLGKLPDSSD